MKRLLLFAVLIVLLRSGSAQVLNGNFDFEGLNRTYNVYLPADYQQSQPLPLLIALHGLTQTGQEMMAFSGFNNIADTAGFVAVYPEGYGNAWNVGFPGGSNANDVGFILALIDTLHQRYQIDDSRVYATGFSNGGFLSYRLACEVPEKIAAIAPVAGTMTAESANACNPDMSIPVMHIHGTSDFVVSYNGGFGNLSVDQVIDLCIDFNQCPAVPVIENLPDIIAEGSVVQRYTWSPCYDEGEMVLLKVLNGGHTWPGSVGVTGIGITNRDINASSEIWNFVKKFSRPLLTSAVTPDITSMLIFPNPLSGNLLYINPSIKWSSAELYDFSGRLVFSSETGLNENTLNLPDLRNGLYTLILMGEKKREIIKLISRQY